MHSECFRGIITDFVSIVLSHQLVVTASVFLLHLLGRSVAAVLLSPEFGLHLQPDILKVNISVHRLHVTLGDVIRCWLPVAAVWEIRQLLPGGTGNKIYSGDQQFNYNPTYSLTARKHQLKLMCSKRLWRCRDFLFQDLTCLGLSGLGVADSWGGAWWMPLFYISHITED